MFKRKYSPSHSLADNSGTSAIEFAIVTPVIVFALLFLADVALLLSASNEMQRAARAGIHYFSQGGGDNTAASALITYSWQNRPASSSIKISDSCQCGLQTVVCTSTCSSGTKITKVKSVDLASEVRGRLISRSLAQKMSIHVN